ncbi:MAG: alcohol dehydrogenase [Frankiales bacterium]|jgi:alcohol dehydrogenase|nr:alcohol dehydrogenase [Frankiales bacterium]
MHALVYHGVGQKSWDEVPDPRLQDDFDAIVGIEAATICGTDLHILMGDVPEVTPGRVLGHEAVGVVEAVGSAVRSVQPGDRVVVSCINGCGICRFCRQGRYGQCLGGGGWVLGHLIDGVQAEYARIPFADTSLYRLPSSMSAEAAVLLADILPTSYEVGVLAGRVRPGDTVAVVGAGPIGLAAVMTARLFSPAHIIVIDPVVSRLDAAKRFGADVVVANGPTQPEPADLVMDLTGGLGADVVIEAVGKPETFELCTRLVRPLGHVANIGVHGAPATLHLETLWTKDVTITTGLVDTSSTAELLGLVANRQIEPNPLVTHTFALSEVMTAYDVFSRAGETGALKVVMTKEHVAS